MIYNVNIKARSRNHFCRGKPIIITYSEYLFNLIYSACNAHAPYHQLWPVRLHNYFPYYIISGKVSGKKNY